MKKIPRHEVFTICSAIVLCLVGIIFLDKIFSSEVSGLNQEIFSAVLASIFTVAAMSIVIKLQSKQEREKEFASRLFECKINLYQELLQILFRADDDNILCDMEIQEIENKIGEVSIVASAKLVSCFSQFMMQVKVYGCLYPRSMNESQRKHFLELLKKDSFLCHAKSNVKPELSNFDNLFVIIDELLQAIREDLDVVEGNIKADVSRFVSIPIDKFKMKRNPNIID